MASFMTGLNMAYERKDARGFARKRLVALAMVACILFAFVLVSVLLIFGPVIEKHVRSAVGMGSTLQWIWWAGQWPILLFGVLAAFATLLYLGPDVEIRRWRLITPGAVTAAVLWILASGAFAYYTSNFSSYNKTWGSLAAVIVMLVWLWIAALALLLGGEINAEAERRVEASGAG
jgi:membrane protein